jgi:hypothetical protein
MSLGDSIANWGTLIVTLLLGLPFLLVGLGFFPNSEFARRVYPSRPPSSDNIELADRPVTRQFLQEQVDRLDTQIDRTEIKIQLTQLVLHNLQLTQQAEERAAQFQQYREECATRHRQLLGELQGIREDFASNGRRHYVAEWLETLTDVTTTIGEQLLED